MSVILRPMPIYDKDVNAVKTLLDDQEKVMVTATQRALGPGMAPINPTTVVVTSKRVIILNRVTLGMRKDIESIPFESIVSVRLENGFISSSIYLRVGGEPVGVSEFLGRKRREGQIDGLTRGDALAIYEYLNQIVVATRKATHNY